MKLAVSMLCENPHRRTGLTTLFHEFVSRGLILFPNVSWILFLGPDQEWTIKDSRIEEVRTFPANNYLNRRLFADHFQVPPVARSKGADALLTVGFVPARKCLPTIMQVFSLQHLDHRNRIGLARRLYRHWVMKFSWPRADLVITNSNFARTQILSVYPAFGNHIVQSYEGLQHEQFSPDIPPQETAELRKRFDVEPGYFLWVSNFYPYKQAELLIAAFATLPEELRQKHPLVMVGASWDGALEAAKAQASKLGISSTVRFLDWIEDRWLAPLYRHAAVFCLASREETFGRCVIEAMACGIPCIVNDIPIMREVTGGHALVVDFRNETSVAESLRRIVNDGSFRSKLSQEGIAHARQFTFERLVTERIGAIQRLLAEKGHR